ncbi:DEAD/DEAH box helicase [Asticcacaulis sp. AND118]|uniref:DEAD/DEAH box helicase n=1 Tax=Asticcacaulis sp. AND118 TaxID=2840468 RepID=UPI001CFFB7BA|nr:DEAD/DEAH box helicase [Asticcacaulis sp. AND118]UDF03319.1 DEAD/DEAH box helicase [Asticcacaulis sp. AND118]
MTTFKDLGLSASLLATLEKEGYHTPTPIQAQAIPILLQKHDLLGIAQTGTGKTAAFALPILHHILSDRIIPASRTCRVLVLSPTRELATQIADSFKAYSKGLGLQIATIFGGVKYGPQYKALQGGLDILVATPGRLIDHIEQKTIDLKSVEHLVLDEADQMLDMGFIKPIRQVASRLPAKRQNLFFSATMPKEIAGLANELLTDPKKVEITPEATTAERVSQQVIFIEQQRKRALLSELYADEKLARTLIFTRTKRGADRVAAYLQAGGVEAAAIHGDKNQSQRERALQAFKAGRVRALVATDIAARGIDVDNVTHVINYELPFVAEAYVHRIGRTARAGKEGHSITLVADDERKLLKDIERITRQRIPSWDRRKDQALKLLDEAILASGQTEKPKTPDRVVEKTARHTDPDAERVHKRSRNRPHRESGRDERRDRGNGRDGDNSRGERTFGKKDAFGGRAERQERNQARPERTERYDPMAAERAPAKASREFPAAERAFGDKPRFDGPRGEKPRFDKPKGDRPFKKRDDARGEGRDTRFFEDRPARPAAERAERPAGERPAGARQFDDRKKKPFGKSASGKLGGRKTNTKPRAHHSEPVNRSEGAQLKRRSRNG